MALGHTNSNPLADRHKRSVGVFPNRSSAERALQSLRDSGFSMNRVSVIAKDADRTDDIAGADVRDRVGNKADEGAAVGAVSGGVLGGLTGLLVGLGTLAIPGIGPIMLAGEVATALATTLAGGAIGAAAGGLVGALVGLGIPEERARVYSDRVSRGGYLVIVDGTDAEISRAEAILRHNGIEDYGVYDAPARHTTTTPETAAATAATGTPITGVSPVTPTTPVYQADPTLTPRADVAGRRDTTHKRAVGAFDNRQDAEAALTELRDSGFSMNQVSVIAKDASPNDRVAGVNMSSRTGNKADEGAKAGAATGAAVGGLGGLLVGLGTLAIPGVGPVLAGGAAATALATALSGGAIGAAAGGLTGALVGLGIPENRAKVYNDRLNRGDYLVMVDGTADEVHRAESILKRRNIHEWGVYDASDVTPGTHSHQTTTGERTITQGERL